MMENNTIGIFYIATGVYKTFFQAFLDSLVNLFKGYNKELIVISDGLTEYDHKRYGEVLVHVEEFINYVYPFINTNKFQIVDHYAKKYNIDNILYFDSETIIEEYDKSIDEFLINKINENKLVTMYAGAFQLSNMNSRAMMWGTDVLSPFGIINGNFDDFSLLNRHAYNDHDYQWIQTSFFMSNYNILHYFAEKIKSLTNYNNRILHMNLNFTDEAWVNYLWHYSDYDKIYVDYFNRIDKSKISKDTTLKDDIDLSHTFFKYKYRIPKEKLFIKYGTNEKFEVFLLYNDDTLEHIEKINNFFIKNFNKIKISGYGKPCHEIDFALNKYTYATPIFYRYINLWDSWFDNGNAAILKEKEFYTERNLLFINNVFLEGDTKIEIATPDVYGFINNITQEVYDFNYEKFYEGEFDCIEGKSFDDLMKMDNVDFIIFSKRYINAWLNNDNNFVPKVYNIE